MHASGSSTNSERACGQVLGDRRHALVERRRQRLDAEEVLALVDLIEHRARLRRRMRGAIAGLEQALAQPIAAREHRLAHRVHVDLLDGAHGPLRLGIEEADRLDQIAEELDAQREAIERHEDVDDAAAHGERARILDDRHARVAALDQLVDRARRDRSPRPPAPRRRDRRRRRAAPPAAPAPAPRPPAPRAAIPCDRRNSVAMRCTMARRSGETSAHGAVSSHGRCATRDGAVGSSPAPGPADAMKKRRSRDQRLRRRLRRR